MHPMLHGTFGAPLAPAFAAPCGLHACLGPLAPLPGGACYPVAIAAAGAQAGEGVTYSCEHCRAKFATFAAAEAHERACPMGLHAAAGAAVAMRAGMPAAPTAAGFMPVPPWSMPPGVQLLRPPLPCALRLPSPGFICGAPPLLPAPAIGQRSTLLSDPEGMEGLRDALMEFRKRWDVELRFEPKLVEHLKAKGDSWRGELSRFDKELTEAGVPPVCRSGYLLVVMGKVNETNTDEDFKRLLCPTLCEGSAPRASGVRNDQDEARTDSGPLSASAAEVAPSASLPEEWMNHEVADFCARFRIEGGLRARLVEALRGRIGTIREDLHTLVGCIRGTKHPPGLLSLKLREMENGTFESRGLPSSVEANTAVAPVAGGSRGATSGAPARSRSRHGARSRKCQRKQSKPRSHSSSSS